MKLKGYLSGGKASEVKRILKCRDLYVYVEQVGDTMIM